MNDLLTIAEAATRFGCSPTFLQKQYREGALPALLGVFAKMPPFFLSEQGEPFDGNKLAKRMKSMSSRLGVDITCHGLRRTFAMLAAGQGRSVNALRITLGHAHLTTTLAYLRTSEARQSW